MVLPGWNVPGGGVGEGDLMKVRSLSDIEDVGAVISVRLLDMLPLN